MMIRQRRWLVAAPALWALPAATDAAMLAFTARLDSRCQEFVSGEAVSFDQGFEEFELTSVVLPLRVTSSLELPSASPFLAATAQGFADFYEPRVALDRNPAELALEADCFSVDPDVSYRVISSVQEARTLRFNQAELRTTESDAQEVISSVFLSGAFIVWSQDPFRDLTGLSGRIDFAIEKFSGPDRPAEGAAGDDLTVVFHSALGVTGTPGGVVNPFIEGRGTFLFGGPDLVRELIDPAPDAPPDGFDEMGRVSVMVIPIQEMTYRYQARPGEQFELLARVTVEVNNIPGGTGISAVFGRDFEALGTMLEGAFPDVDGEATQMAVNTARVRAQPVASDQVAAETAPRRGTCGAVGAEAIAVLAAGALGLWLAPGGRRVRKLSKALSEPRP